MSRLPRPVLAVSALWLSLLFGASLVWPMGLGYDEVSHVDMAYVYADDPLHFYGPGELPYTEAGVGIQLQMHGIPPREPLDGFAVPDRQDRPTLAELGGAELVPGTQPNQMVQHPPLSYWLYAAVLQVPGVDMLPWDAQIWVLRLFSILLSAPVPVLCWAAARRLLDAEEFTGVVAERVALVAALVPVSMPNLARVGSSVSNDVPLLAAGSVLLYALARVMTGDISRRTGAVVGIALAVALLTKGFGLVFILAVGLTYLLAVLRAGGAFWPGCRQVLPALGLAAAGGLVGGLWYLRNLVVVGAVQPKGFGEAFYRERWGPIGDGDDGTVWSFPYAQFLTTFVERIWGGIGLADSLTPGPPIVFGWLTLAIAGLFAALTLPGGPLSRAQAGVVALATVSTVLVAMYGSIGLWLRIEGVGPAAAQGRYIYHLIVGLAAFAVVGWARALKPGVWRPMPLLVAAAALATQVRGWEAVLRSWYGIGGSLRSGLSGLLRWSPLPEVVTVTALGLPVIAGLAVLGMLARQAWPGGKGILGLAAPERDGAAAGRP